MADLISVMQVIFTFVLSQFGLVLQTIMDNPIMYLPVLVGLFGAVVFFVIKIVRKFGVRGRRG